MDTKVIEVNKEVVLLLDELLGPESVLRLSLQAFEETLAKLQDKECPSAEEVSELLKGYIEIQGILEKDLSEISQRLHAQLSKVRLVRIHEPTETLGDLGMIMLKRGREGLLPLLEEAANILGLGMGSSIDELLEGLNERLNNPRYRCLQEFVSARIRIFA